MLRKQEFCVQSLLQAEEFKSTPLGRIKLLCSERGPFLSVAEEKGTQDQPSTREQRSRYTREVTTIKSICKHNSGQRRRPPGFCCELCFQNLCPAQVKCGPCCAHPCSMSVSEQQEEHLQLHLAHSDTHCQSGNPQGHCLTKAHNGLHSKPGISCTAQGEGQESSLQTQTWRIKLCLPTRQST